MPCAESEDTLIDLTGKVAIVTGSGRGIGKAIAEQLASAGCSVVIGDVDLAAAGATAQELAARYCGCAVARPLNVTDQASVEEAFAATVADLGRVDILVNNAGVQSYVTFDDMELAEWRRVMEVNLTGMFLCCKAAARVMKPQRWGRIINLSSMSARTGGQASPPNYTTSKAGVIGLTKALARSLGRHNVTVNALAPGIIDTDMISHWTPELRTSWENQIPLGRLGTAQDVGQAVVFLASDLASYITGTTLDINGGYVMS
jgi:3-oxoacyl-[acyl-carrier protein] reductase